MTADAWWLLALAVLIVGSVAVGYVIGFAAGREQGELDATRRIERWLKRQEARR